jgi:dipeptidyl aminopeptidase/acylaminoacyl peptidase
MAHRVHVAFGSLVALMLAGCAPGEPTGRGSSSEASAAATEPSVSAPASPSRVVPTATPPPVVGPGEPWVVYQSGQIMLVRPDGTDTHPLLTSTAATGPQLHPDWSPDGTRLAFAADAPDGTRDVWVANVDGSGLERVFDCATPCGWADDPAWAPDGARLVWQQGTSIDEAGNGVGTLEMLDLASGDRTTVFTAAPTEYLYVPRWSPDGRYVVVELDRFASARLDEDRIAEATVGIVDLEAPTPTFDPVAPWDPGGGSPDWSPDGTSILYVRPEGGERSDVWVVPVAGGEARRLTTFADDGGRTLQPTWTPTGESVILVAETAIGEPRAAMVPATGGAVELIGADEVPRTHPRLRPVP